MWGSSSPCLSSPWMLWLIRGNFSSWQRQRIRKATWNLQGLLRHEHRLGNHYICHNLFAKTSHMAKPKVRGNKICYIRGTTMSWGQGQAHWNRWSIRVINVIYYIARMISGWREKIEEWSHSSVQKVERCINWVLQSLWKYSISRDLRNLQATAAEFGRLKGAPRQRLYYLTGLWYLGQPSTHTSDTALSFFSLWMRKEVENDWTIE